jgi:hypothetical protein
MADPVAHPEDHKEEKKSIGTLESVINETSEFSKKALDISLGLGAAAITTVGLGTLNGANSLSSIVDKGRDGIIGPPSFAAGEKFVKGRDFTTKNFRDEMISGSIQTGGIIYPAYAMMNAAQQGIVSAVSATSYAQYAAAAGIAGRVLLNFPIYFPIAIGGYYIVDHLVKKRTFKGLYSETIKPNFKTDLKNASKYLALPVLANALFAPLALQVPIAVGLTFAYKVLLGWKDRSKSEYKYEPGYLSSTVSVTSKLLKNTTDGLGGAVRAIYTGISSSLSGSPAPTPQPTQSR